MPIKNISNHKDSHHNKLSSSKIAKFAAGAFIAINLLSGAPIYGQNQKTADNFKKKTTSELIINMRDSSDHKKMITTDIKKILATYGPEKGMELINKNLVIEINKLRDSLGLSPLEYSPEVMLSAQKFAEYLDEIESNDHIMSGPLELPNRLDREHIKWEACGENLAEGQTTIQELMTDRWESPSHKKNLLSRKFKKMGLGHKKLKRAWIAIG